MRQGSLLSYQPEELKAAFHRELQAKRRSASQHRMLLKQAAETSKLVLYQARRDHVKAIRAEWDEMTGKDLAFSLRGVKPANEQEVLDFAVQLNVAMCRVWPEARSQSSYFQLFRMMDNDGSGLISFYELVKMVRETLKLSPTQMPEANLLSLWRYIDSDMDGNINSGEFLKLVRRGWGAFKEEQAKLSNNANLLRRPNWNPANHLPFDQPAWREQTMTLNEKRRFYIDVAQREVSKRTQEFDDMANRYDREAQRWSQQRRVATAQGGRRSPPGFSGSASMPALRSQFTMDSESMLRTLNNLETHKTGLSHERAESMLHLRGASPPPGQHDMPRDF